MKRSVIASIFLVLLFCFPLQAMAVELTIRNEEESSARVALAYLQKDKFVVEGWFTLAPDQIETITLHNVTDSDVYIHVAFEDPTITQFMASEWKAECLVPLMPDVQFRYALEAVGGAWEPKNGSLQRLPFQNIHKGYRLEAGKLWFNLNAAAG